MIVSKGRLRSVIDARNAFVTDSLLRTVEDGLSLPRLGDSAPKQGLGGAPPNLANPPTGCRFAPRCPYASHKDGCSAHNPELRAIRPGHLVRSAHPLSERKDALVAT